MIRQILFLWAFPLIGYAVPPQIDCVEVVRNQKPLREFQRVHPCPLNGRNHGPCPGYVKDHWISLCAGGRDDPENLRWQSKKQSAEKDRWENTPGAAEMRRQCETRGGCVTWHPDDPLFDGK